MSPILYELSVPVYIRSLENLLVVLKKGEEHAKQHNVEVDQLVGWTLGHGMNPLSFQIQSASNTAKAVLPRIAGAESVSMDDNETTYAQLVERVQKTIDALRTAKPESFEGQEDREVVIKVPQRELKFTAVSYLQKFGLPNFFFHVTTAYAILRKEGVDVGKMTFLGSA